MIYVDKSNLYKARPTQIANKNFAMRFIGFRRKPLFFS